MAETLKIDIDVSAAKASIDALKREIGTLEGSIAESATKASAAIDKLTGAFDALKTLQISASVGTNLQAIQMALQGINVGNVGQIATQLDKLSKIDVSKLTTTIQSLSTAVSSKLSGQLQGIATGLSNLGGDGSVGKLATDLNRLAKVDVAKVKINVEALAIALAGLKLPPGLDAAAKTLGSLADAAKNASGALKAVRAPADATTAAISSINRELINAAGFSLGFSTTLGGLFSAFQKLSTITGSAGGAIKAFTASLGPVGTALAAIAVGIAAFSTIKQIFGPLVDETVRVTDGLASFKAGLDGAFGRLGAGTQAFAALRQTVKETGGNLEDSVKNFKQFAIATNAAGFSLDQANTLFKQFSIGLRGTGADSVQTGNAFRALTQILSKGTVQAEELRGQLSEALPGGLQTAATALGVTTAELDKLLKSGSLLATDLLPKLGAQLAKQYTASLNSQLNTSTVKLNEYATAIFDLTAAFGGGFLGGLTGGFAAGLDKINDALKSEGLKAFVALIGDLAGVLTNVVLSAIGGFGEGLAAILTVVSNAFSIIKQLVGVFYDFDKSGQSNNTTMRILSSTISSLVGALTVYYTLSKAVQLIELLRSGTLLKGVAAFGANVKAIALSSVANVAYSRTAAAAGISATTLATRVGVLTTAFRLLSLSNPVTAALTVATVAFTLFGDSITNGVTKLVNYSRAADTTGKAIDGLRSNASVIKESVDTANLSLAKTPEILVSSVESIFSYESAVKRAKAQQDEFKDANDTLKDSLRKGQTELKLAAIQQQEYASTLNKASIENRAAKLAVDDGANAAKNSFDAYTRNKTALDANIKSTEGYKRAARGVKTEQASLKAESQGLASASKQNAIAIERSAVALGEQRRATATSAIAIRKIIEANNESAESNKRFGVSLSEQGQALAAQLVIFGQTKEAAGKLASEYERLTRTQAEKNKIIQEEINKNEQAIALNNNQVDNLQKVQVAELARLDVLEKLGKGAEAEAVSLRKNTADRAALTNKTQESTAALALYNASAAIYIKNVGGQAVSFAELTKKAAELTKETGKLVTVSDLQAAAAKRGEDALAKTGVSVDAAKTKTGSFGDVLKDSIAAIGAGFDKLVNIGKGFNDTVIKVTGVTTAFTGLSTAAGPLKSAAEGLTISFPAIAGGLERINTVAPTVGAGFGTIVAPLTSISGVAELLKLSIPEIASGFEKMNASVPALVEPTAGLATSFEKLAQQGSGLATLQTAFEMLLQNLLDSQDAIGQVTEGMKALATEVSNTSTGFSNAIKNIESYRSALDSLLDKIGQVISRLNDMREAASAASSAANSAGGGGNIPTQRYGGLATEAVESTRVRDMSVFKNAPQFRDGTSNTSQFSSTLPGGGIPSILHPNEAVVPLAKGRSIPVQLDLPTATQQPSMDTSALESVTAALTQAVTGLSSSVMAVSQVAVSPSQAATAASDSSSAMATTYQEQTRAIEALTQTVAQAQTVNTQAMTTPQVQPSREIQTGRYTERATQNTNNQNTTNNQQVNVEIQVNASDADSFKRTEDQMTKRLSEKLIRVTRRNG